MEWLLDLLQQARIPARGVLILALEDGRRQQTLQPYLQVFDGQNYRIFDPNTGLQLEQKDHLMWEYHSGALLDLVGGSQSSVLFSVIDQDVPARYVVEQDIYADKLIDFSIHSLPVGEQALFKGILLVPVGVLVVVFMRVFVGLRTTGTFMPVLIAIAFIQTSLVPGIIGFVLIVATGLVIRSYLSHLNLLLVARISAVIISVIIINEQVSRMADIINHQLKRATVRSTHALENTVNIRTICQRLAVALQKVYAEKNVQFECDITEDISFVGEESDAMELLGNLVENAFKYSKQKVYVSAKTKLDYFDIHIEDDGPGVPAHLQHDILQRGARGDTTSPGQGIGLAIAVDIISSYNGGILVDRSALGGAKFIVSLPSAKYQTKTN